MNLEYFFVVSDKSVFDDCDRVFIGNFILTNVIILCAFFSSQICPVKKSSKNISNLNLISFGADLIIINSFYSGIFF